MTVGVNGICGPMQPLNHRNQGGGMSVRPAPGMNGKRKRRGRGGPVGMGGVQGVWGLQC